jgi:proline dehydrogenase
MRAVCKIDYGQFELNENYKYFFTYENNIKKYFVKGKYSESEFTKRQFDMIFYPEFMSNKLDKNFNTY